MKLIFTVINDLTTDQRMIRICSALSEAGHTVELIGRVKQNSKPLVERSYQQTRIKCWLEKGKLFYLEYNLRLFFYLLTKQNYFLTAIDLDTAVTALCLKKMMNRPYFFDAHEMFTEVPEVIDRKKVQQFWLMVESNVFKTASKVYTVGIALKRFFEDRHQRKDVFVVRNTPVLGNLIENNAPNFNLPQEPFILYQGALNKGRGLERLLEILKQFNWHYPLVLVGDGDIKADLEKKVEELGLGNQVTFLGQIAPQYLPMISRSARVGYNVSENLGLSYYYSLNNKFFDYTEAELPSVINEFPEYIEHCKEFSVGILVPHENQKIAEAIVSLMENDAVYLEKKNQCALARKKWNWEVEKQILIDLYQEFHPQR